MSAADFGRPCFVPVDITVTFTTFASLFGGLGLFLLGMRMLTDGLKLSAGNALRSILRSWTRTNVRGLFSGILITAIVQSSSAVIVAIVGFVNAELLTLAQAVWVVFGANIGTTMTGWLVALIGVKVDVGALALPLIGVGMLLRLVAASNVRRAGLGEAVAGFGAFFLGVGILQSAFTETATAVGDWGEAIPGWSGTAAFIFIGILLTQLTQSSSAAIAIAMTAAAGGTLPLELAAPAVIGTSIGTTSTAVFASVGATAAAKRTAWAHVGFNVVNGAAAIALLPLLLLASQRLAALWTDAEDIALVLAVFNTLIKLLGIALIWPFASRFVGFLSRRFVSADEVLGRPQHIDSTLLEVPSLALRGIVLEVARMRSLAFDLARRRVQGTITEPEARRQQEGIVRLGRAIRDFIETLSKGVLPDDVVEALPDCLRAIQHIDDVASASATVGAARSVGTADDAHARGASRDWARLNEVVAEMLATPQVSTSDAPAADGYGGAPAIDDDAEPRDRRLELAYEGLKADLLRAGALGRLRVEAMEEQLLRARRMRRLAESAAKANRRLDPWVARVDGERASSEVR